MPARRNLTILVLDGSKRGRETVATISKGIQANVVSVHTLDSLAEAAMRSKPAVAILGAEHSATEKDTAERLLRDLNPEIQIVRM